MRVTLIHNPNAGDDDRPGADELQAAIRDAGYQVTYWSSKDDSWKKALKKPGDLVAVAGGDGTVGRVARRLIGRGVPLAVLPLGTANNLAHSLGIEGRKPAELIKGWRGARRVKLDAGTVKAPWGTQRFVEGVGAGLFAWSLPHPRLQRTIEALPHGRARVDYARQALKDRLEHAKPFRIEAKLDDKDLSGEYLLFEVMNTRYIGPNLFLGPDVGLSNGALDVVLVSEPQRGILLAYLGEWQDGRMRPPHLPSHRGKQLRIKWTGFDVHIDDKIRPRKKDRRKLKAGRIDISVERGAIEMLVPRLRPTARRSRAGAKRASRGL